MNIKQISAGEFKAKCLHLMDEVQQKHTEIIITKRGHPIAKLVPIDESPLNVFGCLKNSVQIKGNIIAPIEIEWDSNK